MHKSIYAYGSGTDADLRIVTGYETGRRLLSSDEETETRSGRNVAEACKWSATQFASESGIHDIDEPV